VVREGARYAIHFTFWVGWQIKPAKAIALLALHNVLYASSITTVCQFQRRTSPGPKSNDQLSKETRLCTQQNWTGACNAMQFDRLNSAECFLGVGPYVHVHCCRCFGPGVLNRLVKVYCVFLILDGDAKRHKVYTGLGNRCPTSSLRERSCISCTEVLVVGAYKLDERGS